MIDSKYLSNALSARFCLDVAATTERTSEGQKIVIMPDGIEHTISFRVELVLGWRTITGVFVPGNFASSLVQNMNSAKPAQRAAFAVFAKSLQDKGAIVVLEFDDKQADPVAAGTWPDKWKKINIRMKKIGIVLEKNGFYDFQAAFPWATGFFGMSLSLLPLEPEAEEEGAELFRVVRQFERSRINRAACIEIHGTSCKICNFSFKQTYGKTGDGFIHVHHIVPLSLVSESYILNPATDLIPVCPNCHAMLHRRVPPYSINDIKGMLSSTGIPSLKADKSGL